MGVGVSVGVGPGVGVMSSHTVTGGSFSSRHHSGRFPDDPNSAGSPATSEHVETLHVGTTVAVAVPVTVGVFVMVGVFVGVREGPGVFV